TNFWADAVKEFLKYVLVFGVGGAIALILARGVDWWSKTRQERFSETLDKLLHTTEMTAEQYIEKMELITKLDQETTSLRSKVRGLDEAGIEMVRLRSQDAKKIDELIRHRNERESRISALESDVRILHDQVVDWETKYNALRDKYNKAIEITVHALEKAGIEVPDELVLLLGDSI